MALANNYNILQRIVDEFQRRRQTIDINRSLRDNSDPFQLPEDTFQKLYRLSREAAFDLFHEMEQFMQVQRRNTKTPNVVKFITAMHFFAHGSYQKSIGKDLHCSLSQAAVSRCLHEVVTIINDHFVPRYIKFPTTLQERTRIKNGFYEKFNFPGIVGCIDGTHIAITPPPADDPVNPGIVYMNRKGFYSINCQIICDFDLQIMAINARYPGSVHDSAIWMTSNIKATLLRNFNENNDRGTWLLGDAGYPLQPFLLTPIVGAAENTPESRYTRRHCLVRNSVERCIGVLKARFRCLHKDRVLHYKPVVAAKIVYSCVVLHNIMPIRNIGQHDVNIEFEVEDAPDNDLIGQGDLLAEGRAIRNNLIAHNFA